MPLKNCWECGGEVSLTARVSALQGKETWLAGGGWHHQLRECFTCCRVGLDVNWSGIFSSVQYRRRLGQSLREGTT